MSKPIRFETNFSEFADGAAGFPACGHEHPDAALLVTCRSGMDGWTAAPQITSPSPNARILILTQPEEQDPRSAACEAGARRCMLEKNLFEAREIVELNNQTEHVLSEPHPVA